MRPIRAIFSLLAAACLLAASSGCANSGGSSHGYYTRGGSPHEDAFPPGYEPGGHRIGRPAWY